MHNLKDCGRIMRDLIKALRDVCFNDIFAILKMSILKTLVNGAMIEGKMAEIALQVYESR